MQYRLKFFTIILAVAVLSSGCAAQHGYIRDSGAASFSPTSYVALGQFCEAYGFDYYIDEVSSIVKLKRGDSTIKIMPESNVSLVNGAVKRFSPRTKLKNGQVYIPPSLAKYLLKKVAKIKGEVSLVTLEKIPPTRGPTIRRIVIDPGHGGKDPGAVRGSVKEKDIVFDIAKKLKRKLHQKGNFEIIMTRNKDKFVSLWGRSQIANKAKADLFISIHANAARSRRARGFEVYFLSNATDDSARAIAAAENEVIIFENDTDSKNAPYLNATVWDMTLTENRAESQELAKAVCDTSARSLGVKNRGIKSARFYVLKGTHMPAILIEVGFISNKYERQKLSTSAYRWKIAESIATGILTYRKKFEKTEGFTKNIN